MSCDSRRRLRRGVDDELDENVRIELITSGSRFNCSPKVRRYCQIVTTHSISCRGKNDGVNSECQQLATNHNHHQFGLLNRTHRRSSSTKYQGHATSKVPKNRCLKDKQRLPPLRVASRYERHGNVMCIAMCLLYPWTWTPCNDVWARNPMMRIMRF